MKPVIALSVALACAASAAQAQAPTPAPTAAAADPIASLVGQLDLEKYKATIKSLTRFGDRRQGTERNRQALDWIEAQLKSYGCANTERLQYQYTQAAPGDPAPKRAPGIPSGG
ncbi:MAG TPA: peptidase M28, partial [Duganella sp.]|nr:peptidase M28 [Duganella sp.]